MLWCVRRICASSVRDGFCNCRFICACFRLPIFFFLLSFSLACVAIQNLNVTMRLKVWVGWKKLNPKRDSRIIGAKNKERFLCFDEFEMPVNNLLLKAVCYFSCWFTGHFSLVWALSHNKFVCLSLDLFVCRLLFVKNVQLIFGALKYL